ncbi:hypothetical protein [Streptomyces soliscabiei]|uniref:hypothetical protein n=1 Tax=Streptomyces soliscabiei TaxID=588897 RepID=UPI0029AD06AA|nr:hypothetical protein [Streptomyces sp. NY05-11A]MDX2681068.1 hypothetical protein [Streptomyces sp. NY05-11A]
MSPDERRAYVRRIVDASPPLTREDADRLRALIPLQSRLAAERAAVSLRPQQTRRKAA